MQIPVMRNWNVINNSDVMFKQVSMFTYYVPENIRFDNNLLHQSHHLENQHHVEALILIANDGIEKNVRDVRCTSTTYSHHTSTNLERILNSTIH